LEVVLAEMTGTQRTPTKQFRSTGQRTARTPTAKVQHQPKPQQAPPVDQSLPGFLKALPPVMRTQQGLTVIVAVCVISGMGLIYFLLSLVGVV
jgi:hypothetical protein